MCIRDRGKTAKSILISCGARLAPFDIKELRDLMSYDELELDTLGDRKTALFLITVSYTHLDVYKRQVTGRIEKINQVTRGWINYYALGSMKTVMTEIDAHLRTRLRVIIWKQWKAPQKRQWGLQKLGVDKDLARMTAYCGERYYWIATKTCVVRVISKDVLAKAGLISCLDYYNKRHALKLC